ncbi:MAG: hypothetical protein K0S53_2030 [Bacteroidetes bacterium]|nr:hypothetical protein [Bacteroidota bacterium]
MFLLTPQRSVQVEGAATYSWSNGSTGPSITVSPSNNTSYTVTGTSGSCSGSDVANVNIGSALNVSVNSATICSGGSATLTASGAATYSWSNGSTGPSITVSPSNNTSYTVSGTSGSCSGSDVANVTIGSALNVSVNSATICSGGSATLTASGATTYSWSNGSTGPSITVSPSNNTSYTVTGTSGSCSGSDVANVTIGSALNVSVNSATICSGGSATLTASGATTYSWSNGSTGPSITVSPSNNTSYTVTGTSGSCSGSDVANVTIGSALNVSVNSATICSGGSATLTASGATTYSWSTGATTSSITVSPTSTTSYTVTGASGNCSGSDVANVTIGSALNISVNSATICSGGSATLTASGATTYSWSNGSTGPSITVSPSNNTSYTVTGASGSCSGSDVANVNIGSALNVSVNSATICSGGSATLTASGATTYSWSNGSTGPSITVSPSNNTSYTVTGASGSCYGADIANVTIGSALNVSVNSAAICSGGTATLTASGATTYSWSNGSTGPSITVSPSNNTSYTVTGASGSCYGADIAYVTIGSSLNVSVNSANICSGGTATLIASGASDYSWSNGSTGSSITVSPSNNTSYTVTGSSNGCSGSDIAYVNVGSSLNVSVNSTSICPGENATLIASGASSYLWSTGDTGPSITVSPSSNTSYTVTGSSNDCSGTDIAYVNLGSLNISVNSATICAGETATLMANGASSYQWSTGDITSGILTSPMTDTSYIVTGTSAGCTGTATAVVTVNAKPNGSVNPNVSIITGNSTSLLASGGAIYNWSPSTALSCTNCAEPIASPTEDTQYCVEITSSEGCRDTACTTVSVEPKEIKCVEVFVPTAFSPNGDGVNDVAQVFGNCIVTMRFLIFDRWGEKVFEGSSIKDTWDGNLRGEPMNTAVFVYYLKATLVNGEHVSLKGNITLVR